MDATDFDQVWLSAIIESGQKHRNSLPDKDERVFMPAGESPDRAVYSIRPVAVVSVHGAGGYTDEVVVLLVEVDGFHDTPKRFGGEQVVRACLVCTWRLGVSPFSPDTAL